MPIRAIVILAVIAVVLALCFKDEIYRWYKTNLKK